MLNTTMQHSAPLLTKLSAAVEFSTCAPMCLLELGLRHYKTHPSFKTGDEAIKYMNWDWDWVMENMKGRRKREFWWFKNPNYDPMKPMPKFQDIHPPYAPPSAWEVDINAVFKKYEPKDPKAKKRYRYAIHKFLMCRDQDWKKMFQQDLAAEVRRLKHQYRQEDEMIRQQAWNHYRSQMWEQELHKLAASKNEKVRAQ